MFKEIGLHEQRDCPSRKKHPNVMRFISTDFTKERTYSEPTREDQKKKRNLKTKSTKTLSYGDEKV